MVEVKETYRPHGSKEDSGAELLNSIADSCLLSEEEISKVKLRLNKDASPSDILENLVKAGLLTRYQVKQLQEGHGKGLAFGQYRILEELGRGGFGRVYKAKHTLMDRVVALKMISPEQVGDERARTWFLREVRAITALDHPNIVRAYDANQVDGQLFLAMEFVEGPTLEGLVKKMGPLPLHLAWDLLFQSAQALCYAQEQGMVHRDIKPANLLISRAGIRNSGKSLVKIVDFGLARLHNPGGGQTLFEGNAASLAGTPDYISPEQARNLHDVDIRADLYSLGCTFYLALAGRKPFTGKSALELIVQHWEKEAKPLEKLRPEIPPGFVRIIRKLMQKRREDRFASPAELLAEMNFLSGDGALTLFPSSKQKAAPSLSTAEPETTEKCTSHDEADEPPSRTVVTQAGEEDLARTCAVPEAPEWLAEAEKRLFELRAAGLTQPTGESPKPVSERVKVSGGDDGPPDPAAAKSLPEYWRCWYGLLTAMVSGDGVDITPKEYKRIHTGLLAAARASLTLNPGDKTRVYQRLLFLLEPWVSLAAFESAEAAALRSLHQHCKTVAGDLGLQTSFKSWTKWFVVLMAVIFLSCTGLFVAGNAGVMRTLRYYAPSVVQGFLESNPVLCLAVIVPGFVGLLLCALVRKR